MSLSGAINSAAMGLRATQTLSRVNAENVANAANEGFTRRRAMTVSLGIGDSSGPIVGEIRREVDSALTRMSRNEMGRLARNQVVFDSLNNYTVYLGKPGDGVSPAEKFSAFNANLTNLVNLPASTEAQLGTGFAAQDLADSIRGASETLAAVRSDVDMELRYEVSELNQALYDIANINQRLIEAGAGTPEAAQFGDRMDGLVDKVAGIVDIRVFENSDGAVNIYTSGGTALVERTLMQDVTFSAADGTLMAGTQDITPAKPGVRGITEGSLAGLSELKRDILPRFQLQLDEYARGLITTFENADNSLAAGQAGLFTDGGAAYDPLQLDGLAARIQVNDAVKESAGGETWRIRDGIGAATPGDSSDERQIQNFISALDLPMNAIAATGINASISVADYGSQLISAQSTERARAQESAMAARSTAEIVLASREAFEGVNIDEEMQDLQMIQQSYAANSRVLTVVLGMIDTLINSFG